MKDIQLFRIDDRLIHGQVVIGWATVLNSKAIILCDNTIYENDWERELYESCAPEYLDTRILDVKGTIEYLKQPELDLSKTIILVNGPGVVEALINEGLELQNINVGGIHFKEGRENYLPYLYLSDDEIKSFKRCIEKGLKLECCDVPTGQKVDLESLIGQ